MVAVQFSSESHTTLIPWIDQPAATHIAPKTDASHGWLKYIEYDQRLIFRTGTSKILRGGGSAITDGKMNERLSEMRLKKRTRSKKEWTFTSRTISEYRISPARPATPTDQVRRRRSQHFGRSCRKARITPNMIASSRKKVTFRKPSSQLPNVRNRIGRA